MSANHSTFKALVAAFNAHDLDRIMSFFTDDAVLEMPRGPHPWGSRYEGAAAVREALQGRFQGLSDVHYGDDVHCVDGDIRMPAQWVISSMTRFRWGWQWTATLSRTLRS